MVDKRVEHVKRVESEESSTRMRPPSQSDDASNGSLISTSSLDSQSYASDSTANGHLDNAADAVQRQRQALLEDINAELQQVLDEFYEISRELDAMRTRRGLPTTNGTQLVA